MSTTDDILAESAVGGDAVADLVRRAVGGSSPAFERLVVRFQDLAVGTAYAWLRDAEAAQDAAQEAFVEAYLNLDRLREPAAFPGFLRRIVRKHCDRRTRGAQRVTTLDDESLAARAEAGGSSDRARTDARLASREDRVRLRTAIEDLPDNERLAVSLHYLGGLTQAECAEWLDLPLSTVKKRLHTARRRLRADLEAMMEQTYEALRPSRTAQFSETIRFFLSIREGDARAVRALLDRNPALVEAEERWDTEVTRDHGLPAPAGGTPLVRAAERNHVELIELLLARGAHIDRACACDGAESPLWAAVVAGQLDAARCLLAHGAEPDAAAAFGGHAPLHVAAMRGTQGIVELLLVHGADRTRRDGQGRTAADWAALKGHHGIAARLCTPAGLGSGKDLSPDSVESPHAALAADARRIDTGVKVLDLLAPLSAGARIRMRFEPGQGAVVLLGELSRRFALRAKDAGPAVVWAGWERQSIDLGEIEHAFAELSLAPHARIVFSPSDESEALRECLPARAMDEARRLQASGVRDVLVVLFAQRGRSAAALAALPRAGQDAEGSVTLIVAERDGDASVDEEPLCVPWDAKIVFDSGLASIGHFPAIDPLATRSNQLTDEGVGVEHCRVAREAIEVLTRQRQLVRGDRPEGALSVEERNLVEHGRKLQAFLTQPFLVAEPFSGRLGRSTTIGETVADTSRVLAGALREVPLAEVVFKGRLDEILEAAGGCA